MKKILFIISMLFSIVTYAQETVAVLPFNFIENGNPSSQLGKEAQQFLIDYLQKKQKHIKVTPLNARTVNVALHKAGITPDTYDDYTIKEIADIVKADYILIGSITKNQEGSSTTSGGFDSKNKSYNGKNTTTYGSSTSSTTAKYHADVYISIDKKDGTPVFDKNKSNIFIDETTDSWKNSMIWLVRHFPFYK